MLNRTVFTQLSNGQTVYKYRITNDYGEYVEILNYGACIYSLNVLDREGKLGDVVLGIRSPEEIETGRFAGITVGRCANRIAYGRFPLNGKTVQLECNQGPHHLHGGSGNYGRQLFTELAASREDQVCLHLTDQGQGGYNNQADVTVAFTFGNDHSLKIQYRMTCVEDTLLCPTNHAYFHLDESGNICNHTLQIPAERYAVKGDAGLPEGKTALVAGTPLDFRKAHPIRDAFQGEAAGFFRGQVPELDDTFLLGNPAGQFTLAARLESSVSGRVMEVYTDMPALIAFTMYIRHPVLGKNDQIYQGYKAIALETQYVPNAINCDTFEKPLFRAGQALESATVYTFHTKRNGG